MCDCSFEAYAGRSRAYSLILANNFQTYLLRLFLGLSSIRKSVALVLSYTFLGLGQKVALNLNVVRNLTK
jgi:hypothetical protein